MSKICLCPIIYENPFKSTSQWRNLLFRLRNGKRMSTLNDVSPYMMTCRGFIDVPPLTDFDRFKVNRNLSEISVHQDSQV